MTSGSYSDHRGLTLKPLDAGLFITLSRLHAAQLPPGNHTSHKMNFSLQISPRGVDLGQSAVLQSDVIHVSARTTRWRHLPQSISWLIGTKRLTFMLHSEIYG